VGEAKVAVMAMAQTQNCSATLMQAKTPRLFFRDGGIFSLKGTHADAPRWAALMRTGRGEIASERVHHRRKRAGSLWSIGAPTRSRSLPNPEPAVSARATLGLIRMTR
jgi:hypothetical protein